MEKKSSLKTLFAIIGALVSIAAVVVVLYTIFKKYCKITFECDGNCDGCDEECFEEDCDSYEPICCCQDDEDEAEEAGI